MPARALNPGQHQKEDQTDRALQRPVVLLPILPDGNKLAVKKEAIVARHRFRWWLRHRAGPVSADDGKPGRGPTGHDIGKYSFANGPVPSRPIAPERTD